MAGIRAYNAFIRAIKGAQGISHKEAQQAYRGISERLGRAPKAKDVAAHPRITWDAAKAAAGELKKADRRKQQEYERASKRAEAKHQARSEAQRRGRARKEAPLQAPGPSAGPVVGGGGTARRAVSEFDEDYGGFEDKVWYDFEDPLEDTGEPAQ
jgi:hypothetical protein